MENKPQMKPLGVNVQPLSLPTYPQSSDTYDISHEMSLGITLQCTEVELT